MRRLVASVALLAVLRKGGSVNLVVSREQRRS
jgi:hypothetical protein